MGKGRALKEQKLGIDTFILIFSDNQKQEHPNFQGVEKAQLWLYMQTYKHSDDHLKKKCNSTKYANKL